MNSSGSSRSSAAPPPRPSREDVRAAALAELSRRDAAALAELHRADPVAFAKSVGLTPDPWQERLLCSGSSRHLLNCSRQSGKSTIAALKALHRALFWPASLVLVVSPSQRQSGELFRKILGLVGRLEPRPELPEENKLSLGLPNESRVVSLPSNAATVRGFSGASLIIEDEAAFVRDDFYAAIRPMLATTAGALLLMSTPFGKRGHFFDAWANGGDAWERTSIPAEQCPRITKEFLAGERAALGDWRFRQEYGCEFVDAADSFFSYDEVQGAVDDGVAPLFGAVSAAAEAHERNGVDLLFPEDGS